MLIYVAHKYGGDPANLARVRRIVHDLQVSNLSDCFVCPLLAFQHLEYGEIGFEAEMDLCLDLLQFCDMLIVASEPSKGVQREIEYAQLVGMEVVYLNAEIC